MDIPKEVPIVVVGGGEVGLAASILLSIHGVGHNLFERQPTTSIVPKAIGLHNRTMEIFRKMGLEEEVHRLGAPPETYQRTSWWTSFGEKGRQIACREAFGYVLSDSDRGRAYADCGPSRYCNFAQIRLEPVLRQRAEELNPMGILFHHEVDGVMEDEGGAVVTFHCRGDGDQSSRTIRAKYVIGADGGRFLTDYFGMGWKGESDIADMATAHIRAPISQHTPYQDNLIYWFINPELGGSVKSGIMYHLGPYPRHPDTEEYSFIVARLPHELDKPFTKEDMVKRIHNTLQVPELQPSLEVLSVSHWFLQAKWAKSYVSPRGRVFVAGDAAHRICPWGALGGNTGFQDVDNLVWKLALAVKPESEEDYSALLRTYHAERRPVGQRVAEYGLYNMRAHSGVLDKAIGVAPDDDRESNVQAMQTFLQSSSVEGDIKRAAVKKAVNALDIEFYALGAEAGWFYDHSAVFDAEEWQSPQVRANGEFESCKYYPCTMPGHQLPHAWLENSAGERTSTRWLVPKDRLLLLTSSSCWKAVDHDMVLLVVLDEQDGYRDLEGAWARQREVAPSGAVLVRPDNIVAWRWKDGSMLKEMADPSDEMDRIVKRLLRLST